MIIVKLIISNKNDFTITNILEFEMEITKNCHAIISLVGEIPEVIGDAIIYQQLEDCILNIIDNNSNENVPIFCGLVQEALVKQEGNRYLLSLKGKSATLKLDYQKRNRSFQNIEMTYKELVQNVIADIEDTAVLFQAEDRKIENPIYQYEETDWEFLQRIASQLNTSILATAKSAKAQFYFGLPNGISKKDLKYQQEKIWFNKEYYKFNNSEFHFVKKHFMCHDICSEEWCQIGDKIFIDNTGQAMTVVAMRSSLEFGQLRYRYTLSMPEMFCNNRYGNSNLKGISLIGTVLEAKGECVRIKLDIDQEQLAEEAYWYEWMPETGNIMYCMPEIGEHVYLTFDDEEGSARVNSSIRINGSGHQEMQTTFDRYFTTKENKRLYLLPKCMGFVDLQQKVPLKMELNDDVGTNIESNHDVTIIAKNRIWLKGNRINFKAPQEISLIRRDAIEPTVLNMCNGFDAIGQYGTVKMEGSNKREFPVFDSTEVEAYDISGAEMALMTSTPCNAGNTELERQITGAQVSRVNAN